MAFIFIYGLFIFSSFEYLGEATRFLPMIVWDHLNPLVKCKCNWFTIPNIDVFDQVDFVCPTLKINVELLDGYSRPKTDMNANIFRRKVGKDVNMTTLRDSLNNGSFCDPDHSETNKLYTCSNGDEGKSLSVVFTRLIRDKTKNYEKNDTIVFFNNGDGKDTTLNSKVKKCTMVFIVKITYGAKVDHDMSYGKCLNPQPDVCNNITIPCKSAACNPVPPPCQLKHTSVFLSPTTTSITEQSCSNYFTEKLISLKCPTQTCNTIPTNNKVQPTTTMNSGVTQNIARTRQLFGNNMSINPSSVVKDISILLSCNKTIVACKPDSNSTTSGNRASHDSFNKDNFGWGIAVGLAIGIVACCVAFYVYLHFVKNDKIRCRCVEKGKLSLDVEIPKTPGKDDAGFDNSSYAPVTPSAPPEESQPMSSNLNVPMDVKPLTGIVGHPNRLPSVETSSTNFLTSVGASPVNKVNKDKLEPVRLAPLPAIAVKSPPTTSRPPKKHRQRSSDKRKHLPEVDTPDKVDSGLCDGVRAPPTLDNPQKSIKHVAN